MAGWVAGAIVVSGYMAGQAAGDATDAQVAAGDRGIEEQRRQFDLVQEQTAPYREAGSRALTKLEDMISGNYDITETPGYDFRLQEGYKGVERSQAGRRLSGRAAKEMARYGQEYASAEYGNEFNRLSQIANYGVGGVAQSTAASSAASSNISNIYQNQGAARAAGIQGQSQAFQGTAQNLATWGMYNNSPRGGYGAPASVRNSGDAYMPAYPY